MISITEDVAQLGSDDPAKAYQARQRLTDNVCKCGKPAEQVEVAGAIAQELTAKTTIKGKDGKPDEQRIKYSARVRNELCQLLARVADDAQVPALVQSLKDLETREMARWALDRIPTPGATSALVAALDQVGPEFRVGVINALAKRKSPEVVTALHKAAGDPDGHVHLAAVEALANFAEPSNDDVIAAATKTGSPRAKSRAQKARVRFAETLRLAGKREAAISVYKSIASSDADEPQKKAAKQALEQLT